MANWGKNELIRAENLLFSQSFVVLSTNPAETIRV